ncbi:GNAT family N-acetyltransferase [Candidatus Enterococcus ferrettii]|uniref:N-acetyltransferase domain-containing protein n=1 Tax=Candidatus Enterococcus ferrettii TaxID=2815324 RepID=A0ABV0EVI0_9ENTE|nr:GNAT family N-acetyltransferase [Enterococcus sp. 665A]MBO1342173.1 GNAT family N-acetyltransferase [Enterococcus sp. 665A]
MELRLLEDSDLSLVEGWLNAEHVRRWYEIPDMGITIDDWLAEINQRHDAFTWLTYLIVSWQGQPIGLCQYYKCSDSDEDFGTLPLKGTYGIDYLIGEDSFVGKGLGKRMIGLLVEQIFRFTDAERVTADIDPENKASEKALLACGFILWDSNRSRYVKQKN